MKKYNIFLIYILILASGRIFAQTLPVELIYFNFQLSDNKVLLFWGTATETNNAGFEVQRSIDSTWDVLKFIIGAGTSNSPIYYSFGDDSIVAGTKYFYRLKQIDHIGAYQYSDTLEVSTFTGVKKIEDYISKKYNISQNYPNPFNPATKIKYSIPFSSNVKIEIFDALGKKVDTLFNGYRVAGIYEVEFDGKDLSSGIYYYKITNSKFSETRKMVLLR